MQLVPLLLATLSCYIPTTIGLKCLSGHPRSPSVCTSLTYCVTMKSKTGPTQHSCDGNAVGQISLCSRAGTRSRMTSSSSDYYYTQSRSSRLQPPQETCFDGGQLGQICCCSTDFCNSSNKLGFSFVLVFSLILLVHVVS